MATEQMEQWAIARSRNIKMAKDEIEKIAESDQLVVPKVLEKRDLERATAIYVIQEINKSIRQEKYDITVYVKPSRSLIAFVEAQCLKSGWKVTSIPYYDDHINFKIE